MGDCDLWYVMGNADTAWFYDRRVEHRRRRCFVTSKALCIQSLLRFFVL